MPAVSISIRRVSISRERAVDLSHRMIERLGKTPGVELLGEKEFVRNQILQSILAWDREHDKLADEVKKKLAARGRRVVEGTREWELLFAEEMERALAALVGRGE